MPKEDATRTIRFTPKEVGDILLDHLRVVTVGRGGTPGAPTAHVRFKVDAVEPQGLNDRGPPSYEMTEIIVTIENKVT